MDTTPKNTDSHGTAAENHTSIFRPASKWAAVVIDQLFPMPRRKLAARDILDQSGADKDSVLVRDHGERDDTVLADDSVVDLADGNVFRTLQRCEAQQYQRSSSPAKVAFALDDAWKVTLIGKQTGHSLKRLFDLPDDAILLRDHESPQDEEIADGDIVDFRDGPVFITKATHSHSVTKITVVNEDDGREFEIRRKASVKLEDLLVELYEKLGTPRRPDDRLRCESNGADVFQYSALTLAEYIKAGHCKCLVWLFAGGTGGAQWR